MEVAPQPKASLAWRPVWRLPLMLHLNYGRGISSLDARALVTTENPRALASTGFYLGGISSLFGRVSLAASLLLIDRAASRKYRTRSITARLPSCTWTVLRTWLPMPA